MILKEFNEIIWKAGAKYFKMFVKRKFRMDYRYLI